MDRDRRSIYSTRVNINRNQRINPYENPSHNFRDHDNGKSFINIGPRPDEVRQHINTNIRPLRINENKVPAGTVDNRHDLFIYKPPIMHEQAQREQPNRPAPAPKPAPVPNKPASPPPTRNERPERRLQ